MPLEPFLNTLSSSPAKDGMRGEGFFATQFATSKLLAQLLVRKLVNLGHTVFQKQ